ncbi:hypothetical protein HHI36_016876 [Cryptolaemus montrouzieri]|uniref:Cytochrome P450 n=1 Tax=Cryptolaemus montrouzieri TaxID=559131 RepID=A0ABD2NKY1_9CUCU
MFYEFILQSLDKIAVVLVILLFLFLDNRPPWWQIRKSKQKPKIPGPRSIPIIGTRWMFYIGRFKLNTLHEFYDEMFRKYGPIMKEEALFNVPIYNIFERKDIEKVLKSPSKYPVRPPAEALTFYRYSRPDRYASAGLVNEQGENGTI